MKKAKPVTSVLPWYLRELNPEVYLDESTWLSLDFETTNLEKGSAHVRENRVVLSAHAVACGGVVVETSSEDGGKGLAQLQRSVAASRILVAYNAKFELQWLARLGIETSHLLVLDPMIAEYVLAGNRKVPLDLDSVSRRYGIGSKDPVIASLMRGGVCPSDMPRRLLEKRVFSDVVLTRTLARLQLKRLKELKLLPVFFTRCITTPVLARMEMAGLTLDREAVMAEYSKVLKELGETEQHLAAIAGGKNLGSPKQLAEVLYDELKFPEPLKRNGKPDLTPSGRRKTDADTLESLVAKTPEQKSFVTHRRRWGVLNARVTKALEFFRHVCDERDGTFYGSYNQCITQTHRLSSSGRRVTFSDGFAGGTQFQNLPREYKKLFTVRGTYGDSVIVETDGSGLEFRVAAFLGRDGVAQADIVSGADVHRYTASILLKKPEDRVTKLERQDAKPYTFKPLYGGEYGTPDEVRYYEAFKAKYDGIAQAQKGWCNEVLKTKQLRTASGLILYWPHARPDRRDGRLDGSCRRQVMNYPVQGFATADIIPVALTYLHHAVEGSGLRARLINTVHDSVISEVHVEDVEEYLALAEKAFLACTYRYLKEVFGVEFTVPLGLGITADKHWGGGEERKVSYGIEDKRAQEWIR